MIADATPWALAIWAVIVVGALLGITIIAAYYLLDNRDSRAHTTLLAEVEAEVIRLRTDVNKIMGGK